MKIFKNICIAAVAFACTYAPISYGQATVKTITYSDTVKDYGPVMKAAIESLIKAGGGVIKVKYGVYPLLTGVGVVNKQTKVPKISIIGVKNSKGKLPVFKDTDTTRSPHHFFQFQGNAGNPTIVVSMSNLEIIGNNVPYSKSHPFFGKEKLIYYHAISGINVHSFIVENVTIRNFYGRGIYIANFFDRKYNRKNRVESPIVRNCKILNVWGHSRKDDSGDGLEFISANKPLVENNVIVNNLPVTKYIGRCGIVLEHNTEKAIIRNNRIGGYSRNIHAECDWGGHLIEKNSFTLSSIAVTLSEDCAQPETLKGQFSPIVIKNNTMIYKQEYKTYNIPRNTFSFISVHKPSFMLEGLQVINNKMTIIRPKNAVQAKNARVNLEKTRSAYIDVKDQAKVVIKGNTLN